MTLARTDHAYPIFSYPEVRDVRDGNTVFSAVAAIPYRVLAWRPTEPLGQSGDTR